MSKDSKPHSRQDVQIIRRALEGEGVAMNALANLEQQFRRLEEQLEALRIAARSAMNEIGVPGDGYPASIANAYWLLCDVIGESNPASVEAASTDAVSPAPGHQRSDHPEPSPDTSPAKEYEYVEDTAEGRWGKGSSPASVPEPDWDEVTEQYQRDTGAEPTPAMKPPDTRTAEQVQFDERMEAAENASYQDQEPDA